tara:strand:+ start:347 stop:979 length:633 start_codon:yes stop_codon:yes gene_type:complete
MDNTDTKLLGCFISIPKCASKTILSMFELGRNRDNHLSEKTQQCIIYENHQRLKVLESKYNLENIYVFTFVRHPYERIISWFYYHKNIEPYKSQTLNEWIQNGCKIHWKRQNKTDWSNENITPLLQYNFIDGNKKINYIGKIENFEEDCKTIISQLNKILEVNNYPKQLEYKYIKTNTSNKKNNDVITNENKDLIYEMFKKDFDYFEYDR